MAEPKDNDENNWGFGTGDPVSRLAGTLYGTQVKKVSEKVATYDIGAKRLRSTFNAARSEADRSAAILIFALADDLMLSGLEQHLRGHVKGGWAEVSSGNGLLATATDRITLLALLAWIEPVVYSDLRALKSIRNLFAHHPDAIGFDDEKAKSYIATLSPFEKEMSRQMALGGDAPISQRQIYLIRSGFTLTHLVHNLAVGPLAREEHVAPGHVERVNWEELPSNIRELYNILGEHIVSVMKPASSRPSAPTPILPKENDPNVSPGLPAEEYGV